MTTITTNLGPIEGVQVEDGLLELRGIRFAEPPVGELRFRPPVRTGAWEGTHDGTTYGHRSVQPPMPPIMGAAGPGAPDEDCLFLNIVTPAADGARRPVICWIHGGAFTIGSANDYPAASWARGNDIVVVTINYRLGILGFLDLSGEDPSYAGSANHGIADQVAALEWIRDNIADFGGDPDNVTIAGESAGAMSVMSLLGTPAADGLYHRAIASSCGALRPEPVDVASRIEGVIPGEGSFLERVRAASTQDLLNAQLLGGFGFGGCKDGHIVTRSLTEGAEARSAAGVPLIIGSNMDEGTLFYVAAGENEMMFDVVTSALREAAAGGADVDEYVALLDEQAGDGGSLARNLQLFNDFFRRPALEAAPAATRGGAGGWVYHFRLPSTSYEGSMGTPHGSEIAFTFNWFAGDDALPGFVFHDRTPETQALAAAWSATLVQFARTGDPNGAGLPEWPRYSEDDRQVLVLDEEPRVELDPDKAQRDLWSRL
jgi:para-nitrobenzyl esterase